MLDKSIATYLELANEMIERGYEFEKVDLYKSHPTKFLITEKGLRPPLASLAGVGNNAALSIAEARDVNNPFISREDLRQRAGIGKAVIGEFPQDGYSTEILGKPGDRRFRSIASGAFTDERTLHIKCDIIDDYFGNLNIIAIFENDTISLFMRPNAQMFLGEYRGFVSGSLK